MGIEKLRRSAAAILLLPVIACGSTKSSNNTRFENDNLTAPISISAYLSKPDGEGPFPAVILLHGCTGLERERASMPWRGLLGHARFLNENGFVTLIVDSHGSRGIRVPAAWRESCVQGKGFRDRTDDVYGATAYLESLAFVAKGRIGLLGLSQGGSVIFNSLFVGEKSRRERLISAAVAIYPDCLYYGVPQQFYAPILILAAEFDNITPVKECELLVEASKVENEIDGNSIALDLEIIDGTHHAFDLPLNYKETTPIGVVAPDSSATETVRQKFLSFFRKKLKGPMNSAYRLGEPTMERGADAIKSGPAVSRP